MSSSSSDDLILVLNCGSSSIKFAVFDANPHAQDRFLPGTHIPVHAPAMIAEFKPDYVVILPWNLKDEIIRQLADLRGQGTRFVTAVPETTISA